MSWRYIKVGVGFASTFSDMTALVDRRSGAVNDGLPLTSGFGVNDTLRDVHGPGQIAPQFDRRGRISHTSLGLEQIYEGKIEYLGYTLSALMFSTNYGFMFEEIMPLKQKSDIYFTYLAKINERVPLPEASEMSPPTLITSRRTQQTAVMKRYRIGVSASIEGLKTDDGAGDLADNLFTAGMSNIETMGLIALKWIMASDLHYAEIETRNSNEKYSSVAEAVSSEIALFDGVRKRRRGMDDIIDEVRKKMAREGVAPTHVIIPEGMRSQVQHSDAKRDFYLAGPGSRDVVDNGGASLDKNDFGPGLRALIAKAWYIPKSGVTEDPLRRRVTVGNYFVMKGQQSGLSAPEYTSDSRTVWPFDMDVVDGDYSRVDLETAIRHCGRFNRDGSLTQDHYDLAEDPAKYLGDYNLSSGENGYVDPLIYRLPDNSYEVASVLGQVDEAAVPYKALVETGATLYEQLTKSLSAGDRAALTRGVARIDEIYNKPLGDADVAFIGGLDLAVEQATGVAAGNRFGSHDITKSTNIAGGLPGGYGNSAGMRTIGATTNGAVIGALAEGLYADAKAFSVAAENLWRAARSLVGGDHPFFDGSKLPQHMRSSAAGSEGDRQNSIIVFLSNVVDQNKSPLYQIVAGKGPAALGVISAEVLETDLRAAGATDLAFSEAALLASIRNSLSVDASSSLRQVFANAASIQAFRAKYAESDLARKYAGDNVNVTFSTFLIDELRRFITETEENQNQDLTVRSRLTRVLENIVRIVNGVDEVPSDIRGSIEAWWTQLVPITNIQLPAGGDTLLTRLVAPFDALSASGVSNKLAVASPFDVTKYITGSPADIQGELDRLRTDSRDTLSASTLFATLDDRRSDAALTVGAKRRRGDLAGDYEVVAKVARTNQSLFTDVVTERRDGKSTGTLVLNGNLVRRYAKAANEERDPLRRLSVQLVLLARVHRDTFLKWAEKDIIVPFDFVGMRPLCRYETESVVFIKGGEDFGFMAFREVDVQRGHNPVSRSFLYNITSHFAPIILHNEYKHVQRDVRVRAYGGGAGLRAFTPETFDIDDPNPELSVIYALCGYGSLSGSNSPKDALDITGAFQRDIYEGRLNAHTIDDLQSRPLYDSAAFMNLAYKDFNNLRILRGDEHFKFAITGRVDNTFMLPVGQMNYKPATKDFSARMLNKDHFGPNIGPGHGRLRRTGLSSYYTEFQYERDFVPS